MKLLIRFTFFVFVLSSEIFGCAGGDVYRGDEGFYAKEVYYNFLDQKMININQNNNLYDLAAAYVHKDKWDSFDAIKKSSNIEEWSRYLGSKLTPKEVGIMFYGKNDYPSTTISQNAKPYIKKLSKEMVTYIDFLDFQMEIANQDEYRKLPNESKNKAVINRALMLYNSTTDKFLKNRYGYLVMRLYHYTNDYKTELEFYTKNRAILESNWLTKEWVDALRAGAMQNLGYRLEANELYAQIFQNNKTNAHLGYYDFKIKSDADWQNQLARAKSSDDKARLYFLRAMKWENAPIYELESIARIAPGAIWFDRLSYMIMQSLQAQRYSIAAMLPNYKHSKDDIANAKKSYEAQKLYYTEILSSIKNPSFFTLYSLVYLDALSRKPLDDGRFAMLKSKADSTTMPYVNLIGYIYSLNEFNSKDSVSQDIFYDSKLKPILPTLSDEMQTSLLKLTALHMATLYPTNSIERIAAKEYADNDYFDIDYQLADSDANIVENYRISKSKTFLDNKIFTISNQYADNYGTLLAMLFMQKNDFAKAKIYSKNLAEDYRLKFNYNPFNVSLSGNNRKPIKGGYALAKSIDTMSELQSKVKSGSATAIDHYLYANGLYNKSWFGNVPSTQMYLRSIYLHADDANKRAFDLNLAKKEYQLALKATNDRELQARISYQILKIDLADSMLMLAKNDEDGFWGVSGYNDSFDDVAKQTLDINNKFRVNAKTYKTNFMNTKYGKEIIKQCATFQFL